MLFRSYSTLGYRINGTNVSGTWANDWAIPCTALIGQYRIDVQIGDAAGNLTAWGSLPNFWVSPSSVQDKAVPVVVSGTVSPASVAVCKTLSEIRVRATDDVGVQSVAFKIVDAAGVTRLTETGFMRTGTKLDGYWLNDLTIPCSLALGKYTVYAQARDTWQKVSTWVNVSSFDVTAAVPVVAEPMVITNYVAASAALNITRSPITSRTYSAKSTYYFVSSLLYANGNNSGLLSIGHLL